MASVCDNLKTSNKQTDRHNTRIEKLRFSNLQGNEQESDKVIHLRKRG